MRILLLVSGLCLIVACNTHSVGGDPFPSFDILLVDSSMRLNTTTIKEGVPIALLYFSPDCEHCQKETEVILHHMNSFKEVQFYFITNDPLDRLRAFNGHYQLAKYPNIILGRDEQFFLLRHFKGAYPPYLVIYDRHKKQRVAFQGDVTVDTIISSINNL